MELVQQSATRLRSLLRSGEVTASEVLEAHLDQIARWNPRVNAICTLTAESARREAEVLDRLPPVEQGPLHGLPMAIKDLEPTAGIRTTFGSPLFADFVPPAGSDTLMVRRLRAAGAVILGKTNTPEFGAGSQTFNRVFGATRNPWDLSRTPGGSSGGAAAALAARMLPLADGSDFGGSLRNPASFCNVVGLRPSVGRVPVWPSESLQPALSVLGPMARTVDDVALLLSVQAGPDPRAPLALADSPVTLASIEPLGSHELRSLSLAWTPDLAGAFPIEPQVVEVCRAALETFRESGAAVHDRAPATQGAMDAFQVLRAAAFANRFAAELSRSRDLLKDTVIWNIEQGLDLTARDLARAEATRAKVYHDFRRLLEEHDVLAMPVSQVEPFDVETEWVREIEGKQMSTYIDWMASCCIVSLTGLPAISVPAGFSQRGLPIGLQLVGRPNGERELLRIAKAFEEATQWARHSPPQLDT